MFGENKFLTPRIAIPAFDLAFETSKDNNYKVWTNPRRAKVCLCHGRWEKWARNSSFSYL
jgi:hypothetical protein